MSESWRPRDMQTLIPYLSVKDAAAALDFYATAFGATERFRMPMPNGRIGHAEMALGDCVFMLADEFPEMENCARSPATLGATSVNLMVYVPDCDAVIERATAAGATVLRPAEDMFWGDRHGQVQDPFGHSWSFATHQREVSPEELKQAMEAMAKAQA